MDSSLPTSGLKAKRQLIENGHQCHFILAREGASESSLVQVKIIKGKKVAHRVVELQLIFKCYPWYSF